MPLYDFHCSCGNRRADVYRPMANFDEPETCSCGNVMTREFPLTHTDLKPFQTPIEMFSIATEDPAEIRRMQQAGVTVSEDESDPMYGVPIASNRKEKLKALAVAGFLETN